MAVINVTPLQPTDRPEAVRVLAEAFRTNPALVVGMKGDGPSQVKKAAGLYNLMLTRMPGETFVAKDGDDVVGAMRIVGSDRCQPSMMERLTTMPVMIWVLRSSFPAAASWFAAWGKHDPKAQHVHLGPIGVRPDLQGKGIGSRMMQYFVDQLDAESKAGYLETDKDVNVPFYEKFGFKVTEELPVQGVPTWLMWRDPKSVAA